MKRALGPKSSLAAEEDFGFSCSLIIFPMASLIQVSPVTNQPMPYPFMWMISGHLS